MNLNTSATTTTTPSAALEDSHNPERLPILREYFEMAWQIFLRMERDGGLNAVNLTGSRVNPTVKPLPESSSTKQLE